MKKPRCRHDVGNARLPSSASPYRRELVLLNVAQSNHGVCINDGDDRALVVDDRAVPSKIEINHGSPAKADRKRVTESNSTQVVLDD